MTYLYTQEDKQANANLELKMQQSGAAKYLKRQEEAILSGNASETISAKGLIIPASEALAEKLKVYVETSRKGKPGVGAIMSKLFNQIVKIRKNKKLEELSIDYDRIALACSVTLIDKTLEEKQRSQEFLTLTLGNCLEDEARYTLAQLNRGTWFTYKMTDLEKKHSTYTHMRKSLIWQLNDVDKKEGVITFRPWTIEEKKGAGLVILHMLLEIFGDDLYMETVFKKSSKTKQTFIKCSEDMLREIKLLDKELSLRCVEYKPTIIEPKPWKSYNGGGYHTITMDFLKHATDQDASSRDYSKEMTATNAIQSTAWSIDKDILKLQKALSTAGGDIVSSKGTTIWYSAEQVEHPHRPVILQDNNFDKDNAEHLKELKAFKKSVEAVYDLNLKRASKFITQAKGVSIALEYVNYNHIFFPCQADYRLRLYATPGTLNPQGADSTKALLRFGESVLLTDDGMWWLAVNVANNFGYDKGDLDPRAQHTYARIAELREIAKDPGRTVYLWRDADKPFMYVQSVIEFVKALDAIEKGEDFWTSLPVHVDGKCNGIQHYSMIMRDEKVGPLVGIGENLTSHDIYTYAASKVHMVLKDTESSVERDAWFNFGIPRKFAKPPVMTCVYSASRYGFAEQIKEEMADTFDKPKGDDFQLANFLAGVFDSELPTIIGRSAEAMRFLQECVRVYATYYNNEHGQCKGFRWTNPLGTGIHQAYQKTSYKQLTAKLGTKRIKVYSTQEEKEADIRKMVSGICPNFIHGVDAAHMFLSVIKATESDVKSFAMIHDSYGTHASNVDVMVSSLKEAAVEIHSVDLLEDFRQNILSKLPENLHKDIPLVPLKGSMDIEDVYESETFFA